MMKRCRPSDLGSLVSPCPILIEQGLLLLVVRRQSPVLWPLYLHLYCKQPGEPCTTGVMDGARLADQTLKMLADPYASIDRDQVLGTGWLQRAIKLHDRLWQFNTLAHDLLLVCVHSEVF